MNQSRSSTYDKDIALCFIFQFLVTYKFLLFIWNIYSYIFYALRFANKPWVDMKDNLSFFKQTELSNTFN